MNDEVALCKGCNTMKHLDSSGYCGRCREVRGCSKHGVVYCPVCQPDDLLRGVIGNLIEWHGPLPPKQAEKLLDDIMKHVHQKEREAQKQILRSFRRRDFVRGDFYEVAVKKRLIKLEANDD